VDLGSKQRKDVYNVYLKDASVVVVSECLLVVAVARLDIRQPAQEEFVVREDARRLDEAGHRVDHLAAGRTRLSGPVERHQIHEGVADHDGQRRQETERQPYRHPSSRHLE